MLLPTDHNKGIPPPDWSKPQEVFLAKALPGFIGQTLYIWQYWEIKSGPSGGFQFLTKIGPVER